LGLDVTARQYDGEGEIVAEIGRAIDRFQGIVINPAAYTHTSVAVRDALAAAAGLGVPAVEVHLSQPQGREPFRHRSLVAAVCRGSVSGFGAQSYLLALRGLAAVLAGERA
jgi:3-dehydroquinate dehydratase-2